VFGGPHDGRKAPADVSECVVFVQRTRFWIDLERLSASGRIRDDRDVGGMDREVG